MWCCTRQAKYHQCGTRFQINAPDVQRNLTSEADVPRLCNIPVSHRTTRKAARNYAETNLDCKQNYNEPSQRQSTRFLSLTLARVYIRNYTEMTSDLTRILPNDLLATQPTKYFYSDHLPKQFAHVQRSIHKSVWILHDLGIRSMKCCYFNAPSGPIRAHATWNTNVSESSGANFSKCLK